VIYDSPYLHAISHRPQSQRHPNIQTRATHDLRTKYLLRREKSATDLLRGPARGGRKNKTGKRRTSAPAARKTQNKAHTCLFFFFLVRFWAFLAKGSSKTRDHEKKIEYVTEKFTREMFFRGGFFFRVDFLTFFLSDFFVFIAFLGVSR
jgi:hypothetical protein